MKGKIARLPGEICLHAEKKISKPTRESWLSGQKSAEVIVPGKKNRDIYPGEGLNIKLGLGWNVREKSK
jgi:hypothetical protein